MNGTKQDPRRLADFSAVKDTEVFAEAIVGLLSRRSSPVREREICKWFHGTPAVFTSKTLEAMVERGDVKDHSTPLNNKHKVLAYWLEKKAARQEAAERDRDALIALAKNAVDFGCAARKNVFAECPGRKWRR